MDGARAIIQQFSTLVAKAEKRLEDAMRLVSAGRVPSSDEIDGLGALMHDLRTSYDSLRSTAIEEGSASDELPAEEYIEALENRLKIESLRERYEQAIRILTLFETVKSNMEAFDKAIAPYRKRAKEALAYLTNIDDYGIPDDYSSEIENRELFIDAVKMDSLDTDEGVELLDRMGDAYPLKVHQGLMLGKYSLADCGGMATEITEASTACTNDSTEDGGDAIDEHLDNAGVRTEVRAEGVPSEETSNPREAEPCECLDVTHVEGDAVGGADPDGCLYPTRRHYQPKSISVSSWRRELLNSAPKTIAISLPVLVFFECLGEEQFGRISECLSNGKCKSTEVRKSITYMLRKGLATSYSTDGQTVYALTGFACDLVKKEGIQSIRRGRMPFWMMSFRQDALARDESLAKSFLELRLRRNRIFIEYAESLRALHKERRLGPVTYAAHYRSDDELVVVLKWERTEYSCALIAAGESVPDSAENIVVVDCGNQTMDMYASFDGKVFIVRNKTIMSYEPERESIDDFEVPVASSEGTETCCESSDISHVSDELTGVEQDDLTEAENARSKDEASEGATNDANNRGGDILAESTSVEVVGSSEDEPALVDENSLQDESTDSSLQLDGKRANHGVDSDESKSKLIECGHVDEMDVSGGDSEEPCQSGHMTTAESVQRNSPETEDVSTMLLPTGEAARVLCEGILAGTYGKWEDSSYSDRVGVALAFANAIASCDVEGDSSELFYKLLLAADDAIAPHEYTLEQIQKAFSIPDESNLGQALLLVTYLRAMMNPEKPYDHDLWNAFDYYGERFDEFFGSYQCAKKLFLMMGAIREISPQHGYTPAVIDRLGERTRNKNYLQDICDSAKELIAVRKVKNKIIGVREFHEEAFGEHSEFGKAMKAIANDDKSALQDLSRMARRFAGEDLTSSKLDDDAIEEDITKIWRERIVGTVITHKHKGNRDLSFEARKTARDEYEKRLCVIRSWVSYRESHTSDSVLKALGDRRKEILGECERVSRALADAELGTGGEFLIWAVEDIASRLRGKSTGFASYSDFLRTGLITLSDELLPRINKTENRVMYFEPWRRILLHVHQRDISLRDAYKLTEGMGRFRDNYRQAKQLSELLEEEPVAGRVIEKELAIAESDANDELAVFKDSLEIWYAYGRIDDDQRETLAAMADDLQEPLYDAGNFSQWYMLLDALKMIAEEWSSVQYQELLERYRVAVDQLRDGEESSLLDEANKLLEDERNYAVVEDYLNRFEAGERELDRLEHDDEVDEFSRFMSDEVFIPLHDWALMGNKTTTRFKGTAKQLIVERHGEDWTEEQFKSANELVSSWPSNKGYKTTQLKTLFDQMGFNVSYCENVKASEFNVEHYRVHLKPTAHNRQSYSHPIAAFGTEAVDAIDVIVSNENVSAQTVVSLVSSLHANEAVAILVDYHLDRASRRQVAERYMRMPSRPTKFLLIDRVLLMHLALHQKNERLPILLKCTLPLTYLQLFTNGAGPTADEMFCGRVTELDSIMSFNGACILYGGRQLGKTALLKRAASLMNDPSKRQLAVKISIKGLGDELAVVQKISRELTRELRRENKKLAIQGCSTIEEMCLRLSDLFESGSITRLLLLLDETDHFLASIADDEYAQLEPLEDLRQSRPNSFKFVLAGLHNVVRATLNTKNVIFGRLGEPVCIKPLPPRDALRLLRRPLLYLGYHVDYPNIETILTNTNYYPGLVQYFGNKLVESMSTHFGKYYSAARMNPPYPLKEKQLASIFDDNDINTAIREKFMATLELDERDRYMLIAQIIAALYYERKKEGLPTIEGFGVQEIKGFADQFGFVKLSLETTDTFLALLDELCEMGVLAHVGPERDRYRIRRSKFLGYIGSEEDVWNAMEKEDLSGS